MVVVDSEREIRKFHRLLRHESATEIRAVGKEVRSYFVRSENEFVKKCLELNGTANVYAGIQERWRWGTKEEDVNFVRVLPFDFDPHRPPHTASTEENLTKSLKAVTTFWDSLSSTFPHLSVIFSGDGYHVYLPTETIYLHKDNRSRIAKQYRQTAEDVLKQFPATSDARADRVWDLARVMRVPGTTNLKTGRPAHFIQYDSLVNTGLRELILSPIVEEKLKEMPIIEKRVKDLEEAKQKDASLMRVLSGNFLGFPSRSEAEMLATCHLVSFGFSDDEIDAIMFQHKMPKWVSANPSYRQHTIKRSREWLAEHGPVVVKDQKVFKEGAPI